MTVQILTGNAAEILRTLPSESVHCVVTSPPYWGLRAYKGGDGMIGLEPTFDEHLKNLVAVFREVRRVLRDDGTLWLNYGDAYADGRTGLRANEPAGQKQRTSAGTMDVAHRPVPPGLKPKDLMMMPARVAMALQADGWWLRSENIWHKSNPMPESVTDRPTSAHEKMFLLTNSARYFYDAEAVRTPLIKNMENAQRSFETMDYKRRDKYRGHERTHEGFRDKWDGMTKAEQQSNGANLRNVWTIATHSYPGAHFATFPPALIEPCIKAGTSEKGVCGKCGAPWVQVAGDKESLGGRAAGGVNRAPERPPDSPSLVEYPRNGYYRETTGWKSSCECNVEAIPATVLDPFAGAGTVGLVADRMQRDAILIEINPEYSEQARDRIDAEAGLFSDVKLA